MYELRGQLVTSLGFVRTDEIKNAVKQAVTERRAVLHVASPPTSEWSDFMSDLHALQPARFTVPHTNALYFIDWMSLFGDRVRFRFGQRVPASGASAEPVVEFDLTRLWECWED